jgi:hypothetical protein
MADQETLRRELAEEELALKQFGFALDRNSLRMLKNKIETLKNKLHLLTPEGKKEKEEEDKKEKEKKEKARAAYEAQKARKAAEMPPKEEGVTVNPYVWEHRFPGDDFQRAYERIDYEGSSWIYDATNGTYLGALKKTREGEFFLDSKEPDPTAEDYVPAPAEKVYIDEEVSVAPYEFYYDFGRGSRLYERINFEGIGYLYEASTKEYLGAIVDRNGKLSLNTYVPDPTVEGIL